MDILTLQAHLVNYEKAKDKTLETMDKLKSQRIRLNTELDMAKQAEKESMEELKKELVILGYKEDEIDLTSEGLSKIMDETMEKVQKSTEEMNKALNEVGE